MAMARLNRPSIMVYGGTIRAGNQPSTGASLDIVSAFQSYGQFLYDKISEEERLEITQHSCPGAGACGGMYTANTMATAIEALGMSLPYSSSSPADSAEKAAECDAAGAAIRWVFKVHQTIHVFSLPSLISFLYRLFVFLLTSSFCLLFCNAQTVCCSRKTSSHGTS